MAVLLDTWLQQSIDSLAPTTWRRCYSAILNCLGWYEQVDGLALMRAHLHPMTLVSYRRSLQDRAATSTVNTHLCALRVWCAWLIAHNFLLVNPAACLTFVGRPDPAALCALKSTPRVDLLRLPQRIPRMLRPLPLSYADPDRDPDDRHRSWPYHAST